jgi:xanthine/uracil permease
MAEPDQTGRVADLGAFFIMTPLYIKLSRFFPPLVTQVLMVGIYAALIVMIVNFMIPPAHFELVYLDLGR